MTIANQTRHDIGERCKATTFAFFSKKADYIFDENVKNDAFGYFEFSVLNDYIFVLVDKFTSKNITAEIIRK